MTKLFRKMKLVAATAIHVAAWSFFHEGFAVEQIRSFIFAKRGTCSQGYIYANEIPLSRQP